MKKQIKTFALLASMSCSVVCADKTEQAEEIIREQLEAKIITNAAYYIFDNESEFGFIPGESERVTFYSPEGEVVGHLEGNYAHKIDLLDSMLDPQTPLPQPVMSAIKYWPGESMGFGFKKGTPGDFILFYDKHGNTIKLFHFNKDQKEIVVSLTPHCSAQFSSLEELLALKTLKLDLSNLKEIQGLSQELPQRKNFLHNLFSYLGY